jgi:hypothetical protein
LKAIAATSRTDRVGKDLKNADRLADLAGTSRSIGELICQPSCYRGIVDGALPDPWRPSRSGAQDYAPEFRTERTLNDT